jgi:hypothetical protein
MKAQLKTSDRPSGKRLFTKPTLRIYGTVGAMTTAVGNMGAQDGGTSPKHRTQA